MSSILSLDKVIKDLGFEDGDLHDASMNPETLTGDDWLNKSDWLISAKEAGAEKVLFVENNSIVVFARCDNNDEIKDKYNNIWCLSRPRLLFLESPGEISVIDLAQAPIEPDKDERTLNILRETSEHLEKLQKFRIENIESGTAFSEEFDDLSKRADFSLINDLRKVKAELMYNGLDYSSVHRLIMRSIFIRYLEDREILTEEYYNNLAKNNESWLKLLRTDTSEDLFDFENTHSLYRKVLQSKSFTYALFRKLMHDFNGDMFPDISIEEKTVKKEHLGILRDLLYGNVGIQKKLFFYSYKFNIIPLSLISSICEEFYHNEPIPEAERKNNARKTGSFYTPPLLVEFLLSRILTADFLKNKPRLLDPACGSGIFLVEAFRRIVRFNMKNGGKISFDSLKKILKKQIVGIEINEDAARITAFSLNLALLNYLDPPSIIEQIKKENRLPNLIDFGEVIDDQHLNIIQKGNAFSVDNKKLGKFNAIVGNPPWGEVSNENKNQDIMLKWCNDKALPIFYKEASQAFLYLASDLLKNEGHCAMLVSSGVLLNSGTEDFRKYLFKNICLKEIYNFIHIRDFFFKNAISPFLLIKFIKQSQNNTAIDYWSAKQVRMFPKTQAIIFSKYDKTLLINQDLFDNKTWKIYWFSRHADYKFISTLNHLKKLSSFIDGNKAGKGYEKGSKKNKAISKLNSINTKLFSRFSDLSYSDSPKGFRRFGMIDAYYGSRLLIKRGISQKNDGNLKEQGIIVSRYEKDDFCFKDSIYGIKLLDGTEDKYLLFLGILLSSFTRYYFFNTSAGWGTWHDGIRLKPELLQLPIPEDVFKKESKKVISIVKELRNLKDIFNNDIEVLENKLDKAVFDLYRFTDKQRLLIIECCNLTIPFYYDPYNSTGCKPVNEKGNTRWITDYAKCFAEYWQPYLDKDETLRADLCVALSNNIIAIEFYIADLEDDWDLSPKEKLWASMFPKIEDNLKKPFGSSKVLLDGIIQIDTQKSFIIIKRNEKRFWTKSLAYEDAESMMAKRIIASNTETESSK